MQPENRPTQGRIVQFCLSNGELRPAIVIRETNPGIVNLHVFTDGDEGTALNSHIQKNVNYNDQPNPNTWRYPEREARTAAAGGRG